MKNLTFFTLIAIISLTSACTLKPVIGPDGDIKVTGGTASSGSGSGTNTGSGNTGTTSPTTGTSNADNYQPVTKGSTWTYRATDNGFTVNFGYTMTGNTTTLNGLTLNEFNFTVTSLPNELGYYANSNHLYIIRQKHDINGTDVVVNVPYLKDNAAVNETWKGDTFNPSVANYTGQYTGKMLETNITKTVNGTTFTNVFRTHTDLILSYTGTGTGPSQLIESYDYYIAKGVGIIELDSYDNGAISGKEILTSYTIK